MGVTVPLTWPSTAPISLRSLKGELHFAVYPLGRPQPSLALDLVDAVSGVSVKSGQTNENGEFNLEDVNPGYYFLRINPSDQGQITGVIAVAVDATASKDYLDLDLGLTSCGLMYTDRSKCPRGDLNVEELSGRVMDVAGAAIAGAEILLMDPSKVWWSSSRATMTENSPCRTPYREPSIWLSSVQASHRCVPP